MLWSPDSEMVYTRVGHPTLRSWKYPLPGDGLITTIQRSEPVHDEAPGAAGRSRRPEAITAKVKIFSLTAQ